MKVTFGFQSTIVYPQESTAKQFKGYLMAINNREVLSGLQMKAQLWNQLKKLSVKTQQTATLNYRNAKVADIKDEISRITNVRKSQLANALLRLQSQSIQIPQFKSRESEQNKLLADSLRKIITNVQIDSVITINGQTFIHKGISETVRKLIDILPYDDDEEAMIQLSTMRVSKQYIQPAQNKQIYRIGDVNCLFAPLKLQLQTKLDGAVAKTTKKYYQKAIKDISQLQQRFDDEGAHSALIQELADTGSFKIKIVEPLSGQVQKYRTVKVPKARWAFNFINMRFNHVELWQGSKNDSLRVVETDDEFTSQSAINEMAASLQFSKDSFTFSKHDNINYRWIKIGNAKYMEESYHRYTIAENEMANYVKDLSIRLTHDQMRLMQQFINVSGNILLQPYQQDNIKHIDIAKGYSICADIDSKYRQCSLDQRYKLGIPYLTQLRRCDKEFALQHNGLYICKIDFATAPWFAQSILQDMRELQFLIMPILKFLNDVGVQFEVIGGFYGHASKQLEYKDGWIESKAYFKYPSKCLIYDGEDSKIVTNAYIGEEELAQIVASSKNVIKSTKSDGTYHIITQKKNKPVVHTLMHYGVFVLQYQQLALILQLRDMQRQQVIGMIGDDIYYKDHKFDMKQYFSMKDTNKCEKISWNCNYFINNPYMLAEPQLELLGDAKDYAISELHLGPGGYGKSHSILRDKGNINMLYTTLTNDLVNQQAIAHSVKASTKDLFISKFENRQLKSLPSVIVVDEIGLTGAGIIHYIKEKLPNAILYALGDPLQLQNRLEEQYNPELYDRVIGEEHYKIDYRSKDPKLTQLKQQIRKWMLAGDSECTIFNRLQVYLKITNVVDEHNYDPVTDIITTHSNKNKDEYTEKLKTMAPKYRVVKFFNHNGRDYYTGQIITNIEFTHKNLQLQHAFTCHSLQGQTHTGKMFITQPSNHEIFRGYCYTAVSRCVNLDQLYIVFDIKIN